VQPFRIPLTAGSLPEGRRRTHVCLVDVLWGREDGDRLQERRRKLVMDVDVEANQAMLWAGGGSSGVLADSLLFCSPPAANTRKANGRAWFAGWTFHCHQAGSSAGDSRGKGESATKADSWIQLSRPKRYSRSPLHDSTTDKGPQQKNLYSTRGLYSAQRFISTDITPSPTTKGGAVKRRLQRYRRAEPTHSLPVRSTWKGARGT